MPFCDLMRAAKALKKSKQSKNLTLAPMTQKKGPVVFKTILGSWSNDEKLRRRNMKLEAQEKMRSDRVVKVEPDPCFCFSKT